jgi:hypothetical protein
MNYYPAAARILSRGNKLKEYICSMSRNYKFHNPFTAVP